MAPLGPYDLIVDDASHKAKHQVIGFDLYWPLVKPGGWYVVEDLYWRNYASDPGHDSMIKKLHTIHDDMNRDCNIESIFSYYNIVFIKKRNI